MVNRNKKVSPCLSNVHLCVSIATSYMESLEKDIDTCSLSLCIFEFQTKQIIKKYVYCFWLKDQSIIDNFTIYDKKNNAKFTQTPFT